MDGLVVEVGVVAGGDGTQESEVGEVATAEGQGSGCLERGCAKGFQAVMEGVVAGEETCAGGTEGRGGARGGGPRARPR